MKNNLAVTLIIMMISFIVSSCDSSNTSSSNTTSSKSEASNSIQSDKIAQSSEAITFTKPQLESVLPKKLGKMKRIKMSVKGKQDVLQAKSLYLSKGANAKRVKINLFDLSKFKGDKTKIQTYAQLNAGIFVQIDKKMSDRFIRSEKIEGYPAVIEETSIDLSGEKYKDSKLAILFDHRLYVEMEGNRMSAKELQGFIGSLNLKLLREWNY